MDSNPLGKVDSWKELVPSKNLRSVGSRKPEPKKLTKQKNIKWKNKKSRSVTMQLPTAPRSVKTKSPERKKLRSVSPEPEEPRSVVDTLEAQ